MTLGRKRRKAEVKRRRAIRTFNYRQRQDKDVETATRA